MNFWLNQTQVDQEEERLRQQAAELDDTQRKQLFQSLRRQIKDPDTYAALNWSLMAGLHHFYLGHYGRAMLEWLVFVLGVFLIWQTSWGMVGWVIVIVISLLELWELFRSQIIVQNHNNQITDQELSRIR